MEIVELFRGLNNVTDLLRLDLDWLVQADNVDITDTGALRKRAGYTLTLAGTLSGAYGTNDHQRAYVVDAGALKALTGSASAVQLASGLDDDPMHWAEVNDQVFYNNGIDAGIINADNTLLPWMWPTPSAPTLSAATGSLAPGLYQARCTYVLPDGRETGAPNVSEIELAQGQALQLSAIRQVPGYTTRTYIAPANSAVFQLAHSSSAAAFAWNFGPDALGQDLKTADLDPLPAGCDVIQFWQGRAYAAMPMNGQTAIFVSKPLGFHLFDLGADAFMVPGRVLMLAPHDKALLIGTDDEVYAYDGKALTTLAEYGVVPGWCWAKDGDDIMFWSLRGLCRALPFVNLTEGHASVAPGIRAGAAVIVQNGQKKFVVALHQGGTAFNSRP